MNLAEVKELRAKDNAIVHLRQETALEVIDWLIAEVERLEALAEKYRLEMIRCGKGWGDEVAERDRYKSALEEFVNADNAYSNSYADSFEADIADDRLIGARRNARQLLNNSRANKEGQ